MRVGAVCFLTRCDASNMGTRCTPLLQPLAWHNQLCGILVAHGLRLAENDRGYCVVDNTVVAHVCSCTLDIHESSLARNKNQSGAGAGSRPLAV